MQKWLSWTIGLSLTGMLVACSPTNQQFAPAILNSRYTDEQPALSGDGRFIAFLSNRGSDRQMLMYDLQKRELVDLLRLNQQEVIIESPSLSYTGRYLVYLASTQGRTEIKLYDRVTKRSQSLTPGYVSWLRNPSISADGRYIIFETSRRGQWDIEVLDRGLNIELDIPNG